MDEPAPPSAELQQHPGRSVVATGDGGIPAGPAVRRIAREIGIDLATVHGSGPRGRIVVEDLDPHIRAFMAARAGMAPAAAAGAPPAFAPVELPDFSKWGPVRIEKADPLRRKIAENMARAWATIPHVHHNADADVTALMALQKRTKQRAQEQGVALTLTPFLIKAVVAALREFPILNSSFNPSTGEIVYKDYHHIGVAVDTPAGLVVPVVRDADRKSLVEIAGELEDLARRARERKVTLDEMRGGTFTISNLGGIGGGHFNPIVNAPEVAILGVGRGAKRPAFAADGTVEARIMLPVTLGYDHRVVDGAVGARFLVRVVDVLENFEATILGF